MTQRRDELHAELAELDDVIAALAPGSPVRLRQEAKRDRVRAALVALADEPPLAPAPPPASVDQSGQAGGVSLGTANTIQGGVTTGDVIARDKHAQQIGTIHAGRDAFVATQQTIVCFYGPHPPVDAQALLTDYLAYVANECSTMRLQRIAGQRQTGREQPAVPELRLQAVYTSLTTDGPPVVRLRTTATVGRVRRLLERLEQTPRSPEAVAPERVIAVGVTGLDGRTDAALGAERRGRVGLDVAGGLDLLPEATAVDVTLTRAELALEALARQRRLVLLGEPGSGKSTVLRYLAALLAQRACGVRQRLAGWADDATPVPILVPLAQVAEHLAHAHTPDEALWQTLGAILDGPQGLSAGLRDALSEALRRDGVILLCDGLDELSAEGGTASPRSLVAQAVQRLGMRTQARIVVTSRVLPYQSATTWQLPAAEGWQVRTISPLAFGQVQTFVQAWFRALTALDPDLTVAAADQTAATLLDHLAARPALAPLVRSPLLLTMLTLLHDNHHVPDDEVELYEECVLLLLDRWEPVRQPGLKKRPGLLERLGQPPGLTLAHLRDPLHQLAYEAHRDGRGDEGRGIISDDLLQGRLVKFFQRLRVADPLATYETFKAVLAEEAGLLVARGDDAFAFPHLSFQEYLAACYLADQPTMSDLAYAVWQSEDRERWRKVLVLLAGRLVVQGKAPKDGFLWLKQLWAAARGGQAKPDAQRYQDTRLAVLTYQGMGGLVTFAASYHLDLDDDIVRPLRQAIVALLNAPTATVPPSDRLIVGRVLGELGDPRCPVTLAAWQASLAQRTTVLTVRGDHYWRFVPGGRYPIGGWADDDTAVAHELAPFWIARYPITVAQYAAFVAEGYDAAAERWWTPEGWQWKQWNKHQQPRLWDNEQYNGANQPVIGVTWYEATAFCAWLSERLADVLPTGFTLRLPTEAMWEVAAACAGPAERRAYPWGDTAPTPEQAVYDVWQRNAPAPVGLCPAGAAACGALDMVGNVWEWASSRYKAYPGQADQEVKDFTPSDLDVPWRGYAYYGDSTYVRCGARYWALPSGSVNYQGFRVVAAPLVRTDVLNSVF
ncbi:SUMF1/EgtB/PvdO family nonheme iron enzyme [Candidatus Chloroploca sp. M-50]|uniref:SUMF1/EgtB/PvdO family nonheme iron enzyme n=1 Tax=Candidatus Chloroploca mongolica TaxID=2528176 RepID=A0ABS4DGI8_9CHLR|nr:SUMF1/EgtB/PvdO family nonheme iron enzyme [Candidatus Chloroploca mongolica]MBP1468550.1 SUMF1/EgtB/PvdO family nonheme iron enzyme [Candidatus Chloroploca mongolica]